MSSIYLLIPLSILLVIVAVAVFFWAVHSGQYDDMDSPATRILLDDDEPTTRAEKLEESEQPKSNAPPKT